MDNLINNLLAEYSETVEETTIKYLDGKEWHEYDFIMWLIKRYQQIHENAELIKSLLRDDRDRLRADRDRWKAEAMAARELIDWLESPHAVPDETIMRYGHIRNNNEAE